MTGVTACLGSEGRSVFNSLFMSVSVPTAQAERTDRASQFSIGLRTAESVGYHVYLEIWSLETQQH